MKGWVNYLSFHFKRLKKEEHIKSYVSKIMNMSEIIEIKIEKK